MKRSFKILGIIFAVFIVLIIVALILVRIFITPEKVKDLIVSQMSETLKREVEIQDLTVGIFKGVSVEGFKVSEPPTFKEGTFISSEKFLIRYRLLPLLKKQFAISTVILEGPHLNIIRKPEGDFNFSDLLRLFPEDKEEGLLPEGKKQTQKIPAFSFLVSRAKLKDGEVNFVDYSAEAISLRVHNVNLDISGISLISPMDIRCSARLEHKEASGSLSFDGKLDLDKGILRIEELSPSYNDISLTIKGHVENLKEKPKLDITLQDKKIVAEHISKILPLPDGIELRGSPRITMDISGSADNIVIKADANMDDITAKYKDVFEKKRGEKCGLKFEAEFKDNDRLSMKEDKTIPPAKEEKKASISASIASTPSSTVDEIIKGIKVDGALKIDRVIYRNLKLSKADAKITMRQGKLEVKPFSLEGYEGALSGELGANLKPINDIRFTTSINLKNINFNPLFMDLHTQRSAKIHGKGSFDIMLSGESSKIPDSLKAAGFLKIENGKIESGMPLLGQFMSLLGKPQPEAIFFSELKGHYRLEDKRIITEDLQMIGNDVNFDAQGWADLDRNLHFDVTARLNEKLFGEGIRKHIVRDKQGRSLLFLIVKGNMNKPDIQPDVQKTLTEQAKQKAKDSVLDRVLGEKDDELRKTIEKGLNQLFKFK